jgi:hypothetical protein
MRQGVIEEDVSQRAFAHFNVSEKAKWLLVTDTLPQEPGDSETE